MKRIARTANRVIATTDAETENPRVGGSIPPLFGLDPDGFKPDAEPLLPGLISAEW